MSRKLPVPLGFAERPSQEMLLEMQEELDALLLAVGSFEAHYHNFGHVSHVFNLWSNDPEVVEPLVNAIASNLSRQGALPADSEVSDVR